MFIRRMLTTAFLAVSLTSLFPCIAGAQTGTQAGTASPTPAPNSQPADMHASDAPDPLLYFAPFDQLPGKDPFAQGKWSFLVYGSGSDGKNSNAVYGGHVGVGYHFLDGMSIGLELGGEALHMQDTPRATGGDTAGGALDLVLRWHFIRGDGWSIFADMGGGIMHAADSFPSEGTNFSFRAQAGLGGTIRITDDLYFIGGARWFHISNARIEGVERNPSFDSVQYYAGILIPF